MIKVIGNEKQMITINIEEHKSNGTSLFIHYCCFRVNLLATFVVAEFWDFVHKFFFTCLMITQSCFDQSS